VRPPLRQPDDRRCPRCLYALAGLPAQGPCPECGAPYEPADFVRETAGDAARRPGASPRAAVRDARLRLSDLGIDARALMILLAVLIGAAGLLFGGWRTIRAINKKFAPEPTCRLRG